jgi:hypothetical protein
MKSLHLVIAFCVAALPYLSAAQDKPVAAAVAKHACKPPGEAPGKLASANQIKNHRKELSEFRVCLTAYAQQLRDEAQARILAANAAVEEYNQQVAKLRSDDDEKK